MQQDLVVMIFTFDTCILPIGLLVVYLEAMQASDIYLLIYYSLIFLLFI